MVIFYNVLPCVNYFDEGGVEGYKKDAFPVLLERHTFFISQLYMD